MCKLLFFLLLSANLYANEAKANLGERLFNDVRFSKLFVTNSASEVNNQKAKGQVVIVNLEMRSDISSVSFVFYI